MKQLMRRLSLAIVFLLVVVGLFVFSVSISMAENGNMFAEIDSINDYVLSSIENCASENEAVTLALQLLQKEAFVVRAWQEGNAEVLWKAANGITSLIDCSFVGEENEISVQQTQATSSGMYGDSRVPPVSVPLRLPTAFFGGTTVNSDLKILALHPWANYSTSDLDALGVLNLENYASQLASIAGGTYDYYEDDAVTLEKLSNWGQYGAVIIICHGFNGSSDSGIQLPRSYFYRPAEGLMPEFKDPMWDDLVAADAFVDLASKTRIGLKASFFKNFSSVMNDTFIYFGACHVMKRSGYATELHKKGAALVTGYTGSVALVLHEIVMDGFTEIFKKPWATSADIKAKETSVGVLGPWDWDRNTAKFIASVKTGKENATLLHNVGYTGSRAEPLYSSIGINATRQIEIVFSPSEATNYYLNAVTVGNPFIATASIVRNNGKASLINVTGKSGGYTSITVEIQTLKQGLLQIETLTFHVVVRTSSQQLVDFYANRDGNYLAHHVYIGVPPAAPSLPAVSGT